MAGAVSTGSADVAIFKMGYTILVGWTWEWPLFASFLIVRVCDVVLGSQNWTRNGNEGNDENTLVIHNEALSTSLQSEFNRLWKTLRKIKTCQW